MTRRLPSPAELREALSRWKASRPLAAAAFAREARLENLETVHRVRVEAESEDRRWIEGNGEAPPSADELPLPIPLPEGRTLYRVPGSERRLPCAPCRSAGDLACMTCSGLGRVQCPACRGPGCGDCRRRGTVDCASCDARGRTKCPDCGGQGAVVRAQVLEIVRSCVRSERTVGPFLQGVSREIGRARAVMETELPPGGDASRLPGDLPPAVREAATELLREAACPPLKSPRRRITIEQFPVWKAEWRFGRKSGTAWFLGDPLSAVVQDAPRNVPLLAGIGGIALLAPAAALLVWLAFRPDSSSPEPELSKPPPAPAPAPVEASATPLPPPPPPPPEGAADALVLLAQGGARRGGLRTTVQDYVLTDAQGEHRFPPWEVDAVFEDAAARIREKLAQVEKLERESSEPGPAHRERLIRVLLRIHRERDSWVAIEPLCRPGEIPSGEPPLDRLDALIARLTRRLDERAAPAEPPPAEPVPPVEDPGPILVTLGRPLDAAGRNAAASRLGALAPALGALRDLAEAARLALSRDPHGWGLERDMVSVDDGRTNLVHAGLLEASEPRHLSLRLPQGGRVVAFREEGGTWFANLPGGMRVDRAECSAQRGVPTRSGEAFRAHLERFPPGGWPALPPGEHARAAAELAGPATAGQEEQGEGLLRRIAAAHASAALSGGAPAEIEAARATLRRLGFTQAAAEQWQRPDDRAAVRGGALLREGRVHEAHSLLSAGGARTFPSRYRETVARLRMPASRREDLEELRGALQAALSLARTEDEGRHLNALLDALAGFRRCARCGGDAAASCTACRGQGSRRLTCGGCNGHGVVIRAGQGGGTFRCPSCKGKPDLGAQSCGKCAGRGRVDCPACLGPFRPPRPDELCRFAVCPLCEGQGGLGSAVFLSCPACVGLGVKVVPAGRPEAVLR